MSSDNPDHRRAYNHWWALPHLLVILLVYASPFLFTWPIVLGLLLIYFLQLLIFHGCILSELEFGRWHASYYQYWLGRLGLRLPRWKITILVSGIIPAILIGIALLRAFYN
jgi:hypothetical protein